MQRALLVTMVMVLAACAPKYSYRPAEPAPNFDRLLVVLDFTQFVDDVGEVFDYNMTDNKTRAEVLQTDISRVLQDKGYSGQFEFAMLASGLGLNPEWGFEHYQDNELLDELIYPPFYLISPFPGTVQDELLRSYIDAQRIAATDVSEDTLSYFKRVRLTPVNLRSASADEDDAETDVHEMVAILHVRVLVPRISFVKAMGMSVVSAGLTLGATGGAFIGVAVPMGRPHSTALLFSNETGEVLWKNFSLGDLTRNSDSGLDKFFKDFPVKP